MDEKQKEELREIIEGQSFGNYQDMMTAKENLDNIAKSVKDLFSITPGHFKKLVKLNYEKSIEIERRKFAEFDNLYIDLFELALDDGGSVDASVDAFDAAMKEMGEETKEPEYIQDDYEDLVKDNKNG